MHKKLRLLALAALSVLNACDDSFTVDETRFKGLSKCQDFKYIQYTSKDGSSHMITRNPNASGQELSAEIPDFTWNFKHHVCPSAAPICQKDNSGDSYCSNIAACKQGEQRFTQSNDKVCHSQTCIDYIFNDDDSNKCSGKVSCLVSDDKFSACGECLNGDKKCVTGDDGIGITMECVNGKWDEGTKKTCSLDGVHNTSCLDDSRCAPCHENATRYIENDNLCIPQVCKNHEWKNEEADEDLGYPPNQCIAEIDGIKQPVGVSCRSEAGQNICGQCANDEIRCSNDREGRGQIETCQNGIWNTITASACSDGAKFVSCLGSAKECGSCLDGEEKLDNVKDENGIDHCMLLNCTNGQWAATNITKCQTDVSCKRDEMGSNTCGDCKNGSIKCENNAEGMGQQYICENGSWTKIYDCDDGSSHLSCLDNSKCGECLHNDTIYKNDSDKICIQSICNNGEYKQTETFECSNSCEVISEIPVGCGECINDAIKCDVINGIASEFICIKGKWVTTQKCAKESCMSDQSACSECIDGSTEYIEDKDHICRQYECTGGKYIETETSQKTNPPVSCKLSGDTLSPGECLNGTAECKGNVYTLCTNGIFHTIHCVDSCNDEGCINDSCDNPGTTTCADGILTLCDENSKSSIKLCSLGQCTSDGKVCAECIAPQCTNEETSQKGTVTQCDGNRLQTSSLCENTSCDASQTECGECTNGDIRCVESETLQTAITQECKTGTWVTKEVCEQTSCNLQNVCGECQNGSQRCVELEGYGVEQTCVDGTWSQNRNCEGGNSCSSENQCGECINDLQKCESSEVSSVIYTCKNGRWKPTESCGSSSCTQISQNKYLCGVCQNTTDENDIAQYIDQSDKSCMIQTCQNGLWVNDKLCDNNASCAKDNGVNTGCGTCINYTTKHSDHYIQSCYNGKYESKVFCAIGVEALGDIDKCIWGAHNFGCYNKTENGQTTGFDYNSRKECTNGNSCRVNKLDGFFVAQCGECVENTHRCKDPLTRQTCVNGTWGFDENLDCFEE